MSRPKLPPGAKRSFAEQDATRAKPRVEIVLAPEEREAADALAGSRGLSRSTLIGQLIRAEVERERRRAR